MRKIKRKIRRIATPKSRFPVSLRTLEDEAAYARAKKRGHAKKPLHKEAPLKEWQHWLLIENEFPYTAVFKTSHMLVPRREISRKQISADEQKELDEIIDEVERKYDAMMINFPTKQSIKHHHHIHLLSYKENRKHTKL